MTNRINKIFKTKYPIIQGGMIWVSGYKLASAVSNAGGLGLIGAGSMYPDVLKEHIKKCKKATQNNFGVNIPMLYPNIEEIIQIIIEERVKCVFTSAGNPKTYTSILQKEGIKVAHVVSSAKFAIKCQDAGVDVVVAEGFEAGGHNGREETTTLCLIPNVRKHIEIPLIAAGGIALGSQIKAVMALGAEGVQIGSLFAASEEASCHNNFKQKIVAMQEGDTHLIMENQVPVRLIKNELYKEMLQMYHFGKSYEEIKNYIGKGVAKKGMFEGDMEYGELEIGQNSSLINEIKPVSEIFEKLLNEYYKCSILDF